MKRVKRAAALLMTAVMLFAASSAVFAASGEVPAKGTYYSKENGNWVKGNEYTWSYKSDGRLTATTTKRTDGTSTTTKYKWKGNFITKIIYSNGEYSVYKYKGTRRVSSAYYYSGGKNVNTYKWNKKKTSYTYKSGDSTYTINVNGKGQIVKEKIVTPNWTDIMTYKYSGGNLKSMTVKSTDDYTYAEKFNGKGYVTSIKGHSGSYSFNVTYTYKTKKGHIVERLMKNKSSDGTVETKFVYSKWKKVSTMRNCDGSGYITFGIGDG